MTETIEVRYTHTALGPYVPVKHKFLVYTDSEGNQFAARGGPGNYGPGALEGSGLPSSSPVYGNIVTSHGPYDQNHPDFDPNAPRELLLSGEDLSGVWQQITDAMDDIKSEGYPYWPLHNSNTAVDDALRRANLVEPQEDDLGENYAPGSGKPLTHDEHPGEPGNLGNLMDLEGWTQPFEQALELPIPPCPLVLDLDGNGTTSVALGAIAARFDYDLDGFAELSGWIGAGDGLLVWDRNGNNRIDSGRELFGSETLLQSGQFAADGFLALAEWDSNLDGRIDAGDPIWNNLRVWTDSDGDGFGTVEEYVDLSEAGVESLDLTYAAGPGVDAHGNTAWLTGTFARIGGGVGQITDYRFATDRVRSLATEWLTVSPEIEDLPDAKGFGEVFDLRQAIVRDTSGVLQNLVTSFLTNDTPAERTEILTQIVLNWTGAQAVDPGSRGPHIDARKLSVLEAFMGRNFVGIDGSSAPNIGAAAALEVAYDRLAESIYAQLMAQTHLEHMFGDIIYRWDATNSQVIADVSSLDSMLNGAEYGDGRVLFEIAEFIRAVRGLDTTLVFDLATLQADPALAVLVVNPFQVPDGTQLADALQGGDAVDVIVSWDGNDTINGMGGDDLIHAGGGDDSVNGGYGADFIYGGSGSDVLAGDVGNDTIYGGGGDDVIDGGAGSDELYGGAGDDVLGGAPTSADNTAWSGSAYIGNTYEGGSGNDTLRGSVGADVYRFDTGDGQDLIQDSSNPTTQGGPYVDRISFGTGINPLDVQVVRTGYNLVLNVGANGDRITVQDSFSGASFHIEEIGFADGTIWTPAAYAAVPNTIHGTIGDDSITGLSGTRNVIHGDDGNDTIIGNNQADELYGGGGNDVLGGAPTSADNTAWGGSAYVGNTYDGGAGNDTLRGALGADVYRFNVGDGQDLIQDTSSPTTQGGPYIDRLIFGAGIAAADIQAVRTGNNLVLNVGTSGDRITIQDSFLYATYQVEQIEFVDGTIWTPASYASVPNGIYGTENADSLSGLAGTSNAIFGEGGNDSILGNNRADVFHGGAGNDVMGGGVGSSDWSAWIGGNYVGDTHVGGVGNDTLRGAIGPDVYRFNLGDGQDTIHENTQGNGSSGNYQDRLILGAGILTADVTATRSGNHLVFNIGANGDRVSVQDWYVHPSAPLINQVERIEFADGTLWTSGAFAALPNTILGTEGADTLTGLANVSNTIRGEGGSDTLIGNNRSDTLYGGAGDDILGGAQGSSDWSAWNGSTYVGNTHNGGTGNDLLRGAFGADTYVFNAGDGQDTIADYQSNNGVVYTDRIAFGSGIAAADVAAARIGSNLVLTVGTGGDQITINGWYDGWFNQVERIEFADGTFVLNSNIYVGDGNANTLTGSANADLINGGAGNDTISGGGGGDLLSAGDGADIVLGQDGGDAIMGGAGNDSLSGGMGDDYLAGGTDDDTVSGGEGNDVVQGGAGGDDVQGGIGNDVLTGDAGNDTLQGGDGNDFLAGGEGDDIIGTGDGYNIIAYNPGGGTDSVTSAASASNTLSFGGGLRYSDLSLSKNGNDLIVNAGGTNDRVVLKDWYAGYDNVIDLQVMIDATNEFDAGSSDPLHSRKVQRFDFRGMVSQFDQALAQSPGLTSWAITNALLQFHLSGSDDAALGGDLSYWYSKNGSLAGIGFASALQVFGGPTFGSDAQTLRAFNGLQEGLAKLG